MCIVILFCPSLRAIHHLKTSGPHYLNLCLPLFKIIIQNYCCCCWSNQKQCQVSGNRLRTMFPCQIEKIIGYTLKSFEGFYTLMFVSLSTMQHTDVRRKKREQELFFFRVQVRKRFFSEDIRSR